MPFQNQGERERELQAAIASIERIIANLERHGTPGTRAIVSELRKELAKELLELANMFCR